MAEVNDSDTVKVHYTGKLSDGTFFDTSKDREPLQFKIGGGLLSPCFEQAVIGMKPGESKTINMVADETHGSYSKDMVMAVERSQIPEHLNFEQGQRLQSIQENGQTIRFTVTEVSDSKVTLDANHPLAGEDLNFDILLVEIL